MKMILLSMTLTTALAGLPGATQAQGILGGGGNNKYSALNSRDSIPPVVVQFSPAERGKVESLEEDLSVMTRLLEKNLERGLGEDAVQFRMNVPLLVTSSGRSVRAMYAQGMGALFMVKLNLPLLSPPKDDAKKPDAANDSEWDRIRQEMASEDESSDLNGEAGNSTYDEEKVDSLKTLILQTLKHATNIRSLQPDEFVAVSVFGTDPGGAATPTSSVSVKGSSSKRKAGLASVTVATTAAAGGVKDKDGPNALAATPATEASAPRPGAGVSFSSAGGGKGGNADTTISSHDVFFDTGKRSYGRGTVLTMRVKKADVDAFAKGEIDFDKFKGRMAFNSYYGNGYGVTSLNSWIQSGRPKNPNRQ